MAAIRPGAFHEQIKRGAVDPVYLVVGDDDHEKSALALAVGEMVEDDLRAFNVERLYGTDRSVTLQTITDAARTLPMMVPRRIVIVLTAEALLAPKRAKGAADEAGDDPRGRRGLIEYSAVRRRRRRWCWCVLPRTARPTRFLYRKISGSRRRWRKPPQSWCAPASTAARTPRAG